MKLHSMEVKHYRSIQNARLECCGRFNVLIGKNNSGKSNLLTALAAFFDGLSNGQVVALTPRIGQELDYHNRVVDEPISITMIFNLSDDERARLMHNIVSEAPQLRNAAEGLSQDLQLWVSWKSLSPQHGFGFVDSVVIRGAESESGTTLLRIGDEAAYELYTKQRSKRDLMEQSSMLDSVIDENASHWRRSFREDRSARLPFRYLLDRSLRSENYPSTQAIVRELEETFQTADSFDEFISSVASFKSDLDSQLSDLSQSQLDHTIDTFGGEQTMVPKYVSRLLDDISDIKILHLRERREPIGEEEAKKLLNLKVSRGGEDTLRSIKQTVNALLGVNIDAFQAPPNAPEREVELDVDNFLVQVNGAGMREALRVVLDFEFQQPDIMLVEEPEIHLHPALEMNMMQYLKRISQDCQIFLTTHSTNFLDTVDMQNVYLVSMDNETKVQKVNHSLAEEHIPRELGLRLSSFFMYDRLVFVEGASDEAIVRELASTIGANLAQSNVGFVQMGGARNFAYYATEASLSFLTKRRVKMWFLLDRDERNDDDVAAFFERVGSHAAVHILARREIENYLIVPRAISKFIGLKRELGSTTHDQPSPSINQVESAIDQHVRELREIVLGKHLASIAGRPVYANLKGKLESLRDTDPLEVIDTELERMIGEVTKRRNLLESQRDEALRAIEQSWDQSSIDIVPGDLLIDRVCQDFGVRYVKETDASRLAGILTADEIHLELKSFLGSVI